MKSPLENPGSEHLNINDGNTEALQELESLKLKDFASLEIASWVTSDEATVLENQAPFHVVGSREQLPRRYSVPDSAFIEATDGSAKKRTKFNTSRDELIRQALEGSDIFSTATRDYLLSQSDLGIFDEVVERLHDEGVELTDEQVDRIFEQKDLFTERQEIAHEEAEADAYKKRTRGNPHLSTTEADDTPPHEVKGGGKVTRGKASGTAIEIDLNGTGGNRNYPVSVH